MKAIEAIVTDALMSVTDLSGRVFPMLAPQDDEKGNKVVPPFAVYTVVTDTESEDMSGDVGIVDVLLQVDVYSGNLPECKRIAKACRKALRTSEEITCTTESSGNGYEDETSLYRNSSDYRILVESEN